MSRLLAQEEIDTEQKTLKAVGEWIVNHDTKKAELAEFDFISLSLADWRLLVKALKRGEMPK